MICPHCGQEHPDDTRFCPETGQEMKLQYWVCKNEGCSYRQPLPPTANFCPNCGTPRDFSTQDNHNDAPHGQGLIFPVFDIVLGQTTITELWSSGKYFGKGVDHHSDGSSIHLTSSIVADALYDQAPIHLIFSEDYNDDIDIWSRILPLQRDMSIKHIAMYCKENQISYLLKDEMIIMILEDGRHILRIDEDNAIYLLKGVPCPTCGSTHFKIGSESSRKDLKLQCNSCNMTYDQFEIWLEKKFLCPKCGSEDIEDDGSDYLQFKCNECGNVWGNDIDEEPEDDDNEDNDEEIICPECGSDDCEDDGSGYMQYECNDCGHVWGDEEEDADDEENNDQVGIDTDKKLYDFFPVDGITIGETAPEDISDWFDDIEYKEGGGCSAYFHNNQVFRRGSYFYKKPNSKTFNQLIINRGEEMFEKWSDMYFDWSLSYNEWISLFQDYDFDIQVLEKPCTKRNSEGEKYLSAKFRASSKDKSIYFGLNFTLGHSGYSLDSPDTLFSIVAGISCLDSNP